MQLIVIKRKQCVTQNIYALFYVIYIP